MIVVPLETVSVTGSKTEFFILIVFAVGVTAVVELQEILDSESSEIEKATNSNEANLEVRVSIIVGFEVIITDINT